jgi:molybdopterin-biosynthesis enzyme MoeA-like protein
MLETIALELPRGQAMTSVTVEADMPEGKIAAGLASLQKDHPEVAIGSYPFYREGAANPFGAQLVIRGRDAEAVERVVVALERMLKELGAAPQRVN